jgi:hypothetical protein
MNVVAANLIQYHAYLEFCPDYQCRYESFHELVRENNREAFDIATTAMMALENLDINDRCSYNTCADEIIRIFSPEYFGVPPDPNRIYTAYLRKQVFTMGI